MKKTIKQVTKCGILLVLLVCVLTVNAYAEGGSASVYLTQEPTIIEEPEANNDIKTPISYGGYIKVFAVLLIICISGLIASTYAAKESKKDPNEQ